MLAGGFPDSRVLSFDPVANLFRSVANMEVRARQNAALLCVGRGKAIMCGGFGSLSSCEDSPNSASATNSSDNIIANSSEPRMASVEAWCARTSTLFALPPMAHARSFFAAAWLHRKLFVFGGKSVAGHSTNSCECFDATTRCWREISSLPRPAATCAGLCCAVAHDAIYLFGFVGSLACFRFDPLTESYEALPDMPRVHDCARAAALCDGQLIAVCGGCTSDTSDRAQSACDGFNVAGNAWVALPPMSAPRMAFASTVWQGKMLVFGGKTGQIDPQQQQQQQLEEEEDMLLASCECFDGKQWSALAEMPAPRHNLMAATLLEENAA